MANSINITLTEKTLPKFINSVIKRFESLLDDNGTGRDAIQDGLRDILEKWSLTDSVNITADDSADTIIEKLNGIICDSTEDLLYRKLWLPYVIEDVLSYADDHMGIKLTMEYADYIARKYVDNGEYDCNITYWDNIENLINSYYKTNE